METLNKKQLVDIVAEETGFTKKDTTTVVDAVLSAITTSLAEGNKIDLSGFGKFEVKERAARQGINPVTKEKIEIAATKVPSFKAAKALKDAVK